MEASISEITFEHYHEAIGIPESKPRLSWRYTGDARNWIQQSYEFTVSFSDEEESHVVQSSDSVFVPWPARPLKSSEEAIVRVRAFGPDGTPTPWSSNYSVQAGLLNVEDWKCFLIEAPWHSAPEVPKRPVLFRRNFTVAKELAKAFLYASAHGVYEALINGRKVGDHVLDPGWSSYNHRLAYQTFDITSQLKQGANTIGAVVGEGWWAGRLGIHGGCRNIWGENVGFIGQIILLFEDGSTEYITTDDEWSANVGGIITSEIYDGETYDARKEPLGWTSPEFIARDWKAVTISSLSDIVATLVPSNARPVRRIQEVKARSISSSPAGKVLVDFGQNLVGWLRVSVQGPEGHAITFQHVEVLEHGEAGVRTLWGANSKDTLILGSRHEIWEPKFTYHGFRYVEVTGWPCNDGVPALEDLVAIVVHTDMERTGFFECSDPLLNKLHQNIVWSMRGNFLSIPTDCPQRGERLGWTGDIQAFGPTATYLYRSTGLLKDWLRDLASEQNENEGAVPPLVVPDVLCKNPMFKTRSKKAQAIWGDVAISLPWTLYSASRDIAILSKQYRSMQSWIDRGIPRKPNNLWDTSNHPQLADWLDPSAPPDDPGNGLTDGEFVANAYLIGMTDLMARISADLDKSSDYTRYSADAAAMRQEFQSEYITPRGRVAGDTQTALALAIYFSLFASTEQERHAGERLVDIIRSKARFKIATGFAGTPILGHALTAVGQTQIFYRMLLHRKNPSWLYPVMMGATTVWERWDSMLPDGSINPGMMTSFNHYALGSIADWMHKVIGGLSAAEPGWKKVRIAPIPGGTITSSKAIFNGPYGLISSEWRIEGTSLNSRWRFHQMLLQSCSFLGLRQNRRLALGLIHFVARIQSQNGLRSQSTVHSIGMQGMTTMFKIEKWTNCDAKKNYN
ncbi:bacterial alpha-L-rhamnosidase-domain-containing protein [Halenospora varia]|nr:bacterial alpha-L-rhamnosidase-domain-containing protein [Halenospora varia]